ncbi:MAG: [protein-PII] uridylyltransferase [Candidatus Methylopumilus sp.]
MSQTSQPHSKIEVDHHAKIWRDDLKLSQAKLREEFFAHKNTRKLLKQQSKLVDRVLQQIWQQFDLSLTVSLVAVGGYGRGELFPYSDVDLLLLLPNQPDNAINERIEQVIGLFWDIGLAVGHSVRTLDECIVEAQKDVTVQTNLLESRLIIGNPSLFASFEAQMLAAMDVGAFFKAKYQEQEQRYARFDDTAYNLEPNIKESPGGLRDLQIVLWILRSLKLGGDWKALVKRGLISQSELRQICKHEQHLQMLRIRLHYMAKRREDRLIFDLQNELAQDLGLTNNKDHRASEQLMLGYYKSAKAVGLFNEILLKLLKELALPEAVEIKPINARFEAYNGLLSAKSNTLLQRNPSCIFEIFLLLQQHPELLGISANLLRTLQRVKKLVNRDFRQDPKNKALFIEILKQPSGVSQALNRMNRYEILGSYIPAFGRVVGQMQHDLFHVYTVDEHILHVLSNLERFSIQTYSHEFPLCSKLFASFDSAYLLYLGALFHDIAKGRGGDHSQLGMSDAKRFCSQHGLSKQDGQLVAWLVGSHLSMSSTAQKSDLSDPQVIEAFSSQMKDERHLTALYLLTVADIRGTSPKVWNAWKAKLLETLFLTSQRLLTGDAVAVADEIMARKAEAQATLRHYSILERFYQPLWDSLGEQYFLRHTSQEIAWHSRLLLAHVNTQTPIVRARLSPAGDGIQVMIYTADRDDLFSTICSFFERIGYTILEAKIHTSKNAYALDTFLVLDHSDKSVSYRDLLNYIEYELSDSLRKKSPPPAPVKGRLSRQVKHMPIKSKVLIDSVPASHQHKLEIVAGDRPGLLSNIAYALMTHDVQIQMAKINTLGKRAEDVFLIAGKNGIKLTEAEIKALEASLIQSVN